MGSKTSPKHYLKNELPGTVPAGIIVLNKSHLSFFSNSRIMTKGVYHQDLQMSDNEQYYPRNLPEALWEYP